MKMNISFDMLKKIRIAWTIPANVVKLVKEVAKDNNTSVSNSATVLLGLGLEQIGYAEFKEEKNPKRKKGEQIELS
jgi:hypothetical protein